MERKGLLVSWTAPASGGRGAVFFRRGSGILKKGGAGGSAPCWGVRGVSPRTESLRPRAALPRKGVRCGRTREGVFEQTIQGGPERLGPEVASFRPAVGGLDGGGQTALPRVTPECGRARTDLKVCPYRVAVTGGWDRIPVVVQGSQWLTAGLPL